MTPSRAVIRKPLVFRIAIVTVFLFLVCTNGQAVIVDAPLGALIRPELFIDFRMRISQIATPHYASPGIPVLFERCAGHAANRAHPERESARNRALKAKRATDLLFFCHK
jgi:hypothetical protein